MTRKLLMKFIVPALVVSMGLITTTSLAAERIDKTIMLDQGTGQIVAENLSYGDTLNLTLKNPTSMPLVFETKYPILGTNRSWVVPANAEKTVSFEYRQPFQDDLTYTVKEQRSGRMISSGTIVSKSSSGQVSTEESTGTADETMATDNNTETQQSGQAATTEQPMERRSAVRGYW